MGVGNCASGIIQGIHYYSQTKKENSIGLKHPILAGYQPKDIEVVCAFDVAAGKVGKDLSEAIFASPNNTLRFAEIPKTGIKIQKGPVLDGISEYAKEHIKIDNSMEADVAKTLKENGAELAVNLLPGGSPKATNHYVGEALKAKCAFVNATPILVASEAAWIERFEKSGLPIVGDDLMDQVGATFLHKALLETLNGRGVHVSETYQLDVGGGTESADIERVWGTKRMIKTKSVESVLPYKTAVVAGSTDFVEFLGNRRDNYFWIAGQYFGGVPFRMDIRLSALDAPNAGSIMLDVIRGVKLALDRKESGNILPISAYGFKHPVKMLSLMEAERFFEEYIEKK